MNIKELEKLEKLREKGVLSDEEFQIQKNKIINEGDDKPFETQSEVVLKKRKRIILTIVLSFITVIILLIFIIPNISEPDRVNNSNNINDIYPKPVVVFKDGNFDKSDFWENVFSINTQIRNIGADGYIRVIATMEKKNGKEYKNTDVIYLIKNQTMDLEFDFPEYETGDGKVYYNIIVEPR